MKDPKITALLELGRMALLAAVASAVASLQAGKVSWTVIGTTAALAAYRAASTYVADNPNIPLKGLFWF